MLGFHDEMGLAVELDYLTFSDVVGCGHKRESVSGWRTFSVKRLNE
jgi:hypothetical protein